jgi:hypothetical protein
MMNLSYMGNRLIKYIIALMLLVSIAQLRAYGQGNFKNEEELKKQAAKFFDEEEYGSAFPLYSQLLSNYPKDPGYNYRFGVCMLKASDEKEKPIVYLEFASQKPDVEKEAFFWLGKAYHLNYRFDDAIGAYNKFKQVASKSQQQRMQVDREIETCDNGKKLLRYITDITVLEKKELAKADFFRSYDLAGIGGKLLVRPDDFTTSLDKKKKDKSVIFLSPNNDMVYYASYGDKGETGKDIYIIRKLPTGGWGKPQALGAPVNTPYDEDFPYLHPNGKVLYFCSKGHNSMGGYDVFKSMLDESTGTWGKPVNVDFPINTPDDDILYVTDGEEQNAYFSSGRASVDGKIQVYKIKVDRRPIDVAMVKGVVNKTRSDQRLDSKITIKDLADGNIVGVFTANSNNGSYFLDLPNGGKFLFTVETPGFKTQSEVVELSIQYELKMLKQVIGYDNYDKLVIKTIQDENGDDAYLTAMGLIKEKAKLEVNKDEPILDVKDPLANNTDTPNSNNTSGTNNSTAGNTSDNGTNSNNTTAGNNTTASNTTSGNNTGSNPKSNKGTLSNDQIVQIAYDDAKETTEEAKELKSEADIAFNIANEKNELALSKAKEAEKILSTVNSITDQQKKQEEIDRANNLNKEADKLTKETVAAFNLAKKLDADAKTKQQEADLSVQYAKNLETAVKSNSKDALAKLEEQQKQLEELALKSKGSNDVYSSLKSEADNKQRELIKAMEKSESLQEDIDGLAKESQNLRSEAGNTKNEELKNNILAQAKELDDEKVEKQKELDTNNEKVARLKDDADRLRNDAEMVNTLMSQIKGSDTSTDIASNNNNTTSGNDTGNNNSNNTVASNNTNTTSGNDTGNKTGNNTIASNNTNTTSGNDTGNNNSNNTVASNNTNTTSGNDTGNNNTSNNTNTNTGTTNTNSTMGNDVVAVNTNANDSGPNAGNTSIEPVDYSVKYENDLSETSKISDDLERENATTQLYTQWVADINKDLEENKKLLKSAKTKDDKTLYKQKIADLEKQAKEKDKLAKDSKTKADKIKQDQVLASNNTNSNPSGNNSNNSTANDNTQASNTSNTNTTGSNTSSDLTSTVPLAYNQQFNDKVQNIDKAGGTPYDQELEKVRIYEQWSKSIDKDIEQKKQEASATTDPEMKALLEMKIKDLEKLSKEKTELAQQSAKKADELKGTNTSVVASNNTNSSDTDNNNTANTNDNGNKTSDPSNTGNDNASLTYPVKHTNELSDAGKLGTPYDQELEKVRIYEQWTKDIETEISEQRTALKSTKKKDEKKAIEQKIKELEVEAKEKKQLADASAKNADKLKDQNVIASNNTTNGNDNSSNSNTGVTTNTGNDTANNNTGNNTSNSTDAGNNTASNNTTSTAGNNTSNNTNSGDPTASNNTSSTGNNTTNTTGNDTANNTVASNTTGNNSSNTSANNPDPSNNTSSTTSSPRYTTITSAALEKKASQLMDQAKELKEQAEVLRSDGSPEEASEKEKESQQKQMEAAAVLADANKTEFGNNETRLNDLAKLSAKNEAADISLAELLKDEAKTYFDKAQESRKMADNATDFYSKESAMQKAYDNEIIALDKQKKANDIYMKYNPGYTGTNNTIASNTNTGNTTNNTTASNNTTTNDTNNSSTNRTSDPASNNTGTNSSNTASSNTTNNNSTNSNTAANNTSSDNSANNNTAANNNTTASNTTGNNTTASNTNDNSTANNTSNNTSANNTSGNDNTANDTANNNTNTTASNTTASNTTASNTTANNTGTNNNSGNSTGAGNPTSTSNDAGNTVASNTGNSNSTDTGNAPLTPEQVQAVKSSQQYKNYISIKSEADQASKEAQREYQVAADYKTEADRLQSQANQLKQDASAATDPGQKQEIQKKVKDYETQANINKTRADSVTELARNSDAASKAKMTEADLFLQGLDEQVYNNLSAVTGDKRTNTTVAKTNNTGNDNASNNTTANNNTTASNTAGNNNTTANNTTANNNTTTNNNTNNTGSNTVPVVTKLSANDVFVKTSGPAYSPSQPIPIDEKKPDGVFFTVQIGAFKNPIPQDLFQGMKPINGEKTPQGVIRYTAGKFTSFGTANSVKDEIRQLGYRDAFVVAFSNGKRISVAEAMALLGNTSTQPVAVNNDNNSSTTSNTNNNTGTTNNTAGNNNTSSNNNTSTITLASNAGNDVAKSEDLVTVKGLLYTVQVGVYARPVSSMQLFNITPLYNEQAPNGYIRYTSGIYNKIDNAVQAKNTIVGMGIKDAFVTAYHNGKRISIAEAKQLEASNGSGVFASASNMNTMPSRGQGGNITQLNSNVSNTPVNTVTNPTNPVVDNTSNTTASGSNNTVVTNPPANTTSITDKVDASVEDAGVVYKVQIGAFKEEVPIELANKYLSVAKRGIKAFKDENGLTVYTLGVYKNYDTANSLKADLVKEGIADAFVVAFKDGKKITVDEARNLLGQ